MKVLFLAYANSADDKLPSLEKEDKTVYGLLADKFNKGEYQLHRDSMATNASIAEHLIGFRQNIFLFSYSGHAGRDALFLEEEAARSEGIAHLLAQCPNLQLVLLNGCSTQGQVATLLEKGIPCVIATAAPVNDTSATNFAIRFFQALEGQATIGDAFEMAKGAVLLKQEISFQRGMVLRKPAAKDQALWGIFFKDEQVLKQKLEATSKEYNERLTYELIDQIRPHCQPARLFWERATSIANWEKHPGANKKAKEIITYSFVGVIGVQLSKLMAIGAEPQTEAKAKKYIEKCLYIAKRSMDLMNFAFITRLWDQQKKEPILIEGTPKEVLTHFFNHPFESSLTEQVRLLQTLYTLFQSHQLPFPFSELDDLGAIIKEGGKLPNTIQQLEALQADLQQGQSDFDQCQIAENQLIDFFSYFAFLVKYKMAAIKRIGYNQLRNADPRYLHRYVALGIDSKANQDAEKMLYTPDTVQTDSVLLYKGEGYEENLNLSPFVIDYNALTFEHGAKICFYKAQAIEGYMEYTFLEDTSTLQVEFQNTVKKDIKEEEYNELMKELDSRKKVNLDQVVLALKAAREAIIGPTLNFDDII